MHIARGLGYQSPHRRVSGDAIPPVCEYSHSPTANASKSRQYSFGSKKSNQPISKPSKKYAAQQQSKFRSAAIYGATVNTSKKLNGDDTNCNSTTERDHSSSSSNNDDDADGDNKSASMNKLEGTAEANSEQKDNEMDDTEGSAIDASEPTGPDDANLIKEEVGEEEVEEEGSEEDNEEKFKFISGQVILLYLHNRIAKAFTHFQLLDNCSALNFRWVRTADADDKSLFYRLEVVAFTSKVKYKTRFNETKREH
jgi:hypothetical protein